MLQCGKDLTFCAKPLNDPGRLHALADHLYSDDLKVLIVRPHRQINGSHTSAVDFAQQTIRADLLSGLGGSRRLLQLSDVIRDQGLNGLASFVARQQRFHFGAQLFVISACPLDVFASLGFGTLDRVLEYLADEGPALAFGPLCHIMPDCVTFRGGATPARDATLDRLSPRKCRVPERSLRL